MNNEDNIIADLCEALMGGKVPGHLQYTLLTMLDEIADHRGTYFHFIDGKVVELDCLTGKPYVNYSSITREVTMQSGIAKSDVG